MRTTPHITLKNSAFELHFDREPHTQLNNMLELNEIKKLTYNYSFLAKPETLQVYTFSGEGFICQWNRRENRQRRLVSKYPFRFFERKNTKTKFESPYSDQLQTAVKGTNHTVTTADIRIIHRRLISKPNTQFEQEPSNRGSGPRGPDGRFARKEDKTPATPWSIPITRRSNRHQPRITGHPKVWDIWQRKAQTHPKPGRTNFTKKWQGNGKNKQLGPLTITVDQMLDSDIEQIISDTQQSGQVLHIKDTNGEVNYNTFKKRIESDLEPGSNFSSSTEIEKEIENIEETNLRRSKRKRTQLLN